MHCLRLTTATTRCALANWNTNQCRKTPTACQTNLDSAGRALAVRDLVAKKALPARAPVTFQRGTSICTKELRFLCKTSKNRSVISPQIHKDLRAVRSRRDVKADSFTLWFYQTSPFHFLSYRARKKKYN